MIDFRRGRQVEADAKLLSIASWAPPGTADRPHFDRKRHIESGVRGFRAPGAVSLRCQQYRERLRGVRVVIDNENANTSRRGLPLAALDVVTQSASPEN
jgi:hypothetical protein